MSGHTKEPWAVDLDGHHLNCVYVVDSDGNVAIARVTNYKMMGVAEANARRIVACVNACEGLTTEFLETPDLAFAPAHTAAKMAEIEQQRDRLLAALNLIEVDKDGDGFICREAMEQVRAAIAAVEGNR